MLTPESIIQLLGLKPLPVEGGYFRQTWQADENVDASALPARYAQAKAFGTAIYFLLHAHHFSALHRLLTDEVYHFYLGDPIELLLLHPTGATGITILGHHLGAGEQVQVVVPRGVWQGSRVRPGGQFALLGTTMAPGFDPSDFELGRREELVKRYPDCAELICALTREPGI